MPDRSPVAADAPGQPSDAAALAALVVLEERLHDPDVRRSPDEIRRLLAEDFVEFGRSGNVHDRETVVAALTGEPEGGDGSVLRAFGYGLRQIGEDAALLTYRTERTPPDGACKRTLRASVWRQVDGRWEMAFHQGTPVPDEMASPISEGKRR